MYNLRNRRKTDLTASSRRRKRTKNQRKPRIIPSEVLMEIIKGFPAKDLMRFRCVSKTWNLVIREPFFAQLHRRISETRPSATTTILMGCIRHTQKLYFYKINPQRIAFHELTIDNQFLNSVNTFVTEIVNGLVCLWRFGNVIVCNITTHEIISLPPQTPNCLDLYPIYALGYDPMNKEYKVLCIWSRPGFCMCTVFIVGKSTEWREVNHPLRCDFVPQVSNSVLYGEVVYNGGALYWLTRPYHGQEPKVVSFDVMKETFLVIDLPAVIVKGIGIQLVRIGGDIFLFSCGSNLFMIVDYQNHVWVERNFKVPSWISPIGNAGNRLIYRRTCDNTSEFDPDGEVSDFVVYGEGNDVVQRSIGSLLYPAKYSVCETVENIYFLRQQN